MDFNNNTTSRADVESNHDASSSMRRTTGSRIRSTPMETQRFPPPEMPRLPEFSSYHSE
ncbi:putative ABC multidrug transporter [Corchorus olitorius]|uniref:ABC multidrug transporter n=1 Tax=Corchorus olitorius TaxID=93759 RepID=A0A1R3KKK1_9ROSI|nr:putative ABC multidrug transporter [Corchorus olitorius]